MSTELFLLKDVANLGQEGDIVKVSPGYARNYLIPQGIAEPVTEAARRRLAKIQAEREKIRRETLAEAKKLGAKLKDASVTIRAKTSEAESLYGSVNAAQILAALKEQGFASLEESMLQLEAPIKALGTYDVPVKVHPDVTETVKVWVVAE
ncbi:MAG: 50S ribosomal protein L9 [Kiritimatiellae bacterium]|jgi:large subunit ribosomal protein L9|nr:50S ribosomal protein L9 [Kiritimatiellia bacterium]